MYRSRIHEWLSMTVYCTDYFFLSISWLCYSVEWPLSTTHIQVISNLRLHFYCQTGA